MDYEIVLLTQDRLQEAVDLVFAAGLDTKDEIEHHLKHLDAHFIAVSDNKIIGVIGWYQDNVHYADEAMGEKFPGEKAYWVGFFAVDKEHQGKGVGSTLLKKIEEKLIEKGESKLWVSSVPETKSYYGEKGFKLFMEGEISGSKKYFLSKDLN